jgi:hypothetical protein
MARKTNYNFEKRQREIQKAEKKAAKAEAKREAAAMRKAEEEGVPYVPPSSDDTIER